MSEYPILVEHFDPGTSLDIGCNDCGHWWRVNNPDDYCTIVECGHCPRCKSWDICARFEEGDKCPGCGVLSLDLIRTGPLKGHCSRRCMLQAEYAKSLS